MAEFTPAEMALLSKWRADAERQYRHYDGLCRQESEDTHCDERGFWRGQRDAFELIESWGK